MKNQSVLYRFLVRWIICSLGLWIAAGLLHSHIRIESSNGSQLGVVIIAGLILALINALIRPLAILLSLPAILLTLGLFMIIINGFTVWLAARLYSPLQIDSFWWAVLAGVVIGLVNYLVTTILERRENK
ncbi:MAG TPA: phage holin family protein [Patescibacteria group bacterium]|nr:phage holin family protein [Patescibacteria group bacterium]